ncbi:MAG: 5'-nucleotidase C-terminal domain-containing protein [Armatimonadota bacterium]
MKRIAFIAIITFIVTLGISGAVLSQAAPTINSTGIQSKETGLGNLTADALRSSTGAQIAFVPAGSFKEATILADTIKSVDVNTFLQYPDDPVNVMELTGAQIVKALERSVSLFPQKNMGFLQVSGITFSFNPKATRNTRVTAVMLNGKTKIDLVMSYRVATTRPFANGAYGYFTIWGNDKNRIKDAGVTISQSIKKYIEKTDLPDYTILGRITQIK